MIIAVLLSKNIIINSQIISLLAFNQIISLLAFGRIISLLAFNRNYNTIIKDFHPFDYLIYLILLKNISPKYLQVAATTKAGEQLILCGLIKELAD